MKKRSDKILREKEINTKTYFRVSLGLVSPNIKVDRLLLIMHFYNTVKMTKTESQGIRIKFRFRYISILAGMQDYKLYRVHIC